MGERLVGKRPLALPMIKTLSIEEHPREKALSVGIDQLSDEELLAIVLRTGNKSENVIELSKRLLGEIGGIVHLKDASYGKLISMKGIKKAKGVELMAILEIGKRIYEATEIPVIFDSPHAVFNLMKSEMMYLKQEHFVILILDQKHRLILKKTLFIGSINASLISMREIFLETLSFNGVALIAIHNHPSGDARPSIEDEEVTKRLIESGKMMNVKVLDHIIIGWNEFYSFVGKHLYNEHDVIAF